MSKQKNQAQNQKEKLPTLEINPSEEYHERPLWQRIGAWILIVMVVIATGIFAIWPKL